MSELADALPQAVAFTIHQTSGALMSTNMSPTTKAPLGTIITDRLLLRPFATSDLAGLAAVFANQEVWQFPYGRAFNREETEIFIAIQQQEWAEYGYGCWIAQERSTEQIIGYVGLSVPSFLPEILPAVEVGWRFDPKVWGQGYASEGARAALREGFTTLGLSEITSVPQADNPPSAAVCERIGMRLEREVVIPANDNRGELTGLLYVMTKTEWSTQVTKQD